MSRRLMSTVTCLGLVWSALSALAQMQSQGAVSLGEFARQVRAERAKSGIRPARVFTNDNLSPERRAEAESPEAPRGEAPSPSLETKPALPPPTTSEAGTVHDEKYYRTEMGKLKAKLERQQRELEILQQKLAQNQMQYYPDPTDTLLQEFTREEITKKLGEIEQKKQQIAETEKAMDELRDQLRREGGYPGWLRD